MFGTNRFTSADTGVRDMDASRECLSFVFDRLFHPQVICADPGGTCERIEDTIRILKRNLEREERLMTDAEYPGLAAHKRGHDELLRKLEKMKSTLICGDYDNALVTDFLTEWTKSHSASFDKPFGDFMRERGMDSVQRRGS